MWGELLPIAALICSRSDELGLSALWSLSAAVATRMSPKALRRSRPALPGRLRQSHRPHPELANCTGCEARMWSSRPSTRHNGSFKRLMRRAWREAFRPHAIIVTERVIPEPLFVSAVIGVDRVLRLDLDGSQDHVTYVTQALDALKQRLTRWKGVLPAFGRAKGFIVNYTQTAPLGLTLTETRSRFSMRHTVWAQRNSASVGGLSPLQQQTECHD